MEWHEDKSSPDDARAKMQARNLRLDADDDEEEDIPGDTIMSSHGMSHHKKSSGGGHSGNTRLPYGLCEGNGIEVPQGTTPHGAWELLEKGTGVTHDEVMKQVKATGSARGVKGKGGKEINVQSKPPEITQGNQPIPQEQTVTQGNQPTSNTQTVKAGGQTVTTPREPVERPTQPESKPQGETQPRAQTTPQEAREQSEKAISTASERNRANAEVVAKDPMNAKYTPLDYNYRELKDSIQEQMTIAKNNGDKKEFKYWRGEMQKLETINRDNKTIKDFCDKRDDAKGKAGDAKTPASGASKAMAILISALLGPIGAIIGGLMVGGGKKGANGEENEVAPEKRKMSQREIEKEVKRLRLQKAQLDFEHEHAEVAYNCINIEKMTINKGKMDAAVKAMANTEFAKAHPEEAKKVVADLDDYTKAMNQTCGQIRAIQNNPKWSDAKKQAKLSELGKKLTDTANQMYSGKYDFGDRTKSYKYMTASGLQQLGQNLTGSKK